MTEMVERVARAIEATMFAPHELPVDDELHGRYLVTARAAITAMINPDLLMWAAGGTAQCATRNKHHDIAVGRIWHDMIDAALT